MYEWISVDTGRINVCMIVWTGSASGTNWISVACSAHASSRSDSHILGSFPRCLYYCTIGYGRPGHATLGCSPRPLGRLPSLPLSRAPLQPEHCGEEAAAAKAGGRDGYDIGGQGGGRDDGGTNGGQAARVCGGWSSRRYRRYRQQSRLLRWDEGQSGGSRGVIS